jgi:hypothetical protein
MVHESAHDGLEPALALLMSRIPGRQVIQSQIWDNKSPFIVTDISGVRFAFYTPSLSLSTQDAITCSRHDVSMPSISHVA